MPSMLLTYEKSKDGRYVATPKYACNICGEKYREEDDAFDCEERGGRPKFRRGQQLIFAYPVDLASKGVLTVLSVKASKPPFGKEHWFSYEVSFPDGDIMVVSEREVRLA